MTYRQRFVIASCSLLGWVAGCHSQPNLQVRIVPENVGMRYVNIEGKEAKRIAQGVYLGPVAFQGDITDREVNVEALSIGGISASQTNRVSKRGPNDMELKIPARVQVELTEVDSQNAVVKIDGEAVQGKNRVYERDLEISEPRMIEISACTKDRRLCDERRISVQAGGIVTERLSLKLSADIDTKQKSIVYGEKIEFDASKSTPSASKKSYIWNFGDGSELQVTQDPQVEHVYRFDQSKPKVSEVIVTLAVRIGGEESKPDSLILPVLPPKDELSFAWDVYPRKSTFRPGEQFQFVLVPETSGTASQPVRIALYFDADKTQAHEGEAVALTLQCTNSGCKPLVLSKSFDVAGRYEPKVTYVRPERGITEPKPAVLRPNIAAIVVSQPYFSNEHLVELAWEDAYRKFDQLLHDSKVANKWLALTSIDCANFETDQTDFVPVIDRLTKMLIEDTDQYNVLEKKSQVLARLAPEAVINVRPEWETGGAGSGDSLAEQPYRQHLEYGLAAEHGSPQQPIIYSIKIAGTNDAMRESDTSSTEQGGTTQRKSDQLPVPLTSIAQADSSTATWLRNLPILMARFKTADILIALKVLEEPQVTDNEAWSFSEELDEPMVRRVAKVRLHVRLIERMGRILKAVDLEGQSEQLVPQSEFSARMREVPKSRSADRLNKND